VVEEVEHRHQMSAEWKKVVDVVRLVKRVDRLQVVAPSALWGVELEWAPRRVWTTAAPHREGLEEVAAQFRSYHSASLQRTSRTAAGLEALASSLTTKIVPAEDARRHQILPCLLRLASSVHCNFYLHDRIE